jgi:ankyrin repeat protein
MSLVIRVEKRATWGNVIESGQARSRKVRRLPNETVKKLLEKGADVDSKGNDGQTPLMFL